MNRRESNRRQLLARHVVVFLVSSTHMAMQSRAQTGSANRGVKRKRNMSDCAFTRNSIIKWKTLCQSRQRRVIMNNPLQSKSGSDQLGLNRFPGAKVPHDPSSVETKLSVRNGIPKRGFVFFRRMRRDGNSTRKRVMRPVLAEKKQVFNRCVFDDQKHHFVPDAEQ